MKRITGFILLVFLLAGCKTISYENALLSNKDKFYGEREDSALLLVDLKNFSQLAEDISGLTIEKAYSKELYDFGQHTLKDHNRFQLSLRSISLFKGIKLPNAVSPSYQETYRSLLEINDKKTFDRKYLAEMDMVLDMLTAKSHDYLDHGNDQKIRNMLEKYTGVFQSEKDRIKKMQEYIKQTDPDRASELTSNIK